MRVNWGEKSFALCTYPSYISPRSSRPTLRNLLCASIWGEGGERRGAPFVESRAVDKITRRTSVSNLFIDRLIQKTRVSLKD